MNNAPARILVVDDERSMRDLLEYMLTREGYQVVLAENGRKAVNAVQENDYDLILSDIRLGDITGLEVLKAAKKKNPAVIVIMISAVKDIESAISAMSKGAYDYVAKPFKLTEVGLIARKAIEKRRLVQENREYQRTLEKMVQERTRELKDALQRLDQTYIFTLRALVTALDTRDEETQGHSLRVVRYTLKLAELMGIREERQIKVLEYGALLHDIGKIGIPDAILKKPGKLTAEEWEVMKTHPLVGYKILHRIEFLEEASQIVLHHHEKIDGSGYPHGLKCDNIPLGSRIFAAADTVDAMTSERPYRHALSFEDASAELVKYSGIQFDHRVVDAFLSVPLDFWKEERIWMDRNILDNVGDFIMFNM